MPSVAAAGVAPPARQPLKLKDRHALLLALARLTSTEPDLPSLLAQSVVRLGAVTGAELTAIALPEDDRARWQCAAIDTRLPCPLVTGTDWPRAHAAQLARAAGATRAVRNTGHASVADWVRTEVIAPVRHAGQVVALIVLASHQPDAFDRRALRLLDEVTTLLAGPISAAQRLALLDRRAVWLETVATVMRQALEAPDLASLCDRLLEALATRLRLAEATILLEGDLRDHLQVVAHRGASPHITWPGKLWPVSDGVVGRCFRERSAQWVPRIAVDPDYAHVNPQVQAELALPIRYGERVFGVLNLETEQASELGALERLAVHALADQAGGALHLGLTNQRLVASLRRMQTQDEQLAHTRASLERAVVRLRRRSRRQDTAELPDRNALLNWLRKECVALRRGGRGAALLVIDWPAVVPVAVAATLEEHAKGLRGRLATWGPGRLGALLGAARDSGSLAAMLPELWPALEQVHGARAGCLVRVDAPARLQPEAWLVQAESLLSAPPGVHWASAQTSPLVIGKSAPM